MNRLNAEWWELFQKHYGMFSGAGLALELSRMHIPDEFYSEMEPRFKRAFTEMAELEAGAIANVDEKPLVGLYWLRAPTSHQRSFKNYLLIGIGGSALGPQFLAPAL